LYYESERLQVCSWTILFSFERLQVCSWTILYIPPQTIWICLVFLLFTRWKLFGGFCLLYLYFAFFVDKTASGNNIL
jgi:hypothetical protein